MSQDHAQAAIQQVVNENDVVLFMKGDSRFPQCGFSAVVADILQRVGVTYKDINVLLDQDIREGVKVFSDWPTIPQLYVKQEFVGGCDIIRDMYETGALVQLFKDNGISCDGE